MYSNAPSPLKLHPKALRLLENSLVIRSSMPARVVHVPTFHQGSDSSYSKAANLHARCPKCQIHSHESLRCPAILRIQLPPRTNARVHRVTLSPRISLNACAPRFPQGSPPLSLPPQHSLAMKYPSPALCEPARSKSAHWKMVCEERRNFRCVARSKTCQEI